LRATGRHFHHPGFVDHDEDDDVSAYHHDLGFDHQYESLHDDDIDDATGHFDDRDDDYRGDVVDSAHHDDGHHDDLCNDQQHDVGPDDDHDRTPGRRGVLRLQSGLRRRSARHGGPLCAHRDEFYLPRRAVGHVRAERRLCHRPVRWSVRPQHHDDHGRGRDDDVHCVGVDHYVEHDDDSRPDHDDHWSDLRQRRDQMWRPLWRGMQRHMRL
jgi:hypothetical protein